jgi:hypothetical protein
MAREIPCCLCKIEDNKYTMVELHNEDAIAALCEAHKNEENIERLRSNSIPTHRLQNVLNQYMEDVINRNNSDVLDRLNDLETVNENQKMEIKELKAKLKAQEGNTEAIIKETVKDIQPTPTKSKGKVNEYGELI